MKGLKKVVIVSRGISTPKEWDIYQMDTATIEIDDQKFEYTLSRKEEGVTIILISGAGIPMSSWEKVFPSLLNLGSVFMYNRLGCGKSTKPNCPQSGFIIISTLKKILEKLGLEPPYLFVGHSLGGLYANLYARLFPNDLLGIVLVDSSHPEQEKRLKQHTSPLLATFKWLSGKWDKLFCTNKFSELLSLEKTKEEIDKAGSFPKIPLTVITGGKAPSKLFVSPSAFNIHLNNQQELTQLSSLGKQVIAKKSGHFVQLSEPELIIEEIRKLMAKQ